MTQSHYKALAKSPKDLQVRGDYLEIAIGNIILNAEVLLDSYSGERDHYLVFEVVCSNLWDFVISTNDYNPVLIDSNGFQHDACSLYDAVVCNAKNSERRIKLDGFADEIQGKARNAGWIVFPKLKKNIVPHRLIFKLRIFDPGQTSGLIKHSETLELIFDLSLYGNLIGDGKRLR